MAVLYIIATPIGNLEDMTDRAVRVLSEVHTVLAEDTRVTAKLLAHFGIKVYVVPWHHHSTERDFQKIRQILAEGKDCAYVTDAGTPGISDPGGKLVELVLHSMPEVAIVPVPGPSALAAAISVAGIPLDEFMFFGFLPHKKGRQTKLARIQQSDIPVILFESVHRIRKTLSELAGMEKQVIVCRELTKKFETIYRGSAAEVLEKIPDSEVKGEFVIIIHTHA